MFERKMFIFTKRRTKTGLTLAPYPGQTKSNFTQCLRTVTAGGMARLMMAKGRKQTI